MKTAPFLFTFQTDLHLLHIFDSCQNAFGAFSKVGFISFQISSCFATLLPQKANIYISSLYYCFFLCKHNLFYFLLFLNVWITAVFQNTCFVFCNSLHDKHVPFFGYIDVSLALLSFVITHSCIMKCFLQAHLFPSLRLQTLLIFFSSFPFLFLVYLYFWTSLLFYFYECSHRHQMFAMQDVCCLNTFRNLCEN